MKVEPEQSFSVEGLERLSCESGVDGAGDWALFLPGSRPELCIVCLHGHGSHGDQLYTRPDIRDSWLPAFRATGAAILTPNLRDNAWMSPAAARDLHDLVTWVRSERGAGHFLFCSGSMGGTGNLIYAVLHPEDVDGLVVRGAASDLKHFHVWSREACTKPIGSEIADAIEAAYGATPQDDAALYEAHSALLGCDRLTMPVYLSHGGADETIPVEEARRLAEAMAGREHFIYEEIEGGNHDAPLWNTEDLNWVLERMG
ncbi:MAG: alpha/beta hydrolase family protein [Planctomycetota bacterium]|jgi:pimeloyl-ACP methyl ester carboxylesterase